MMTISQEAYNDKKEYWDYQRKLEYNRELLIKQIVYFLHERVW